MQFNAKQRTPSDFSSWHPLDSWIHLEHDVDELLLTIQIKIFSFSLKIIFTGAIDCFSAGCVIAELFLEGAVVYLESAIQMS
jgi:hypothetical protein